MWSTGLGERLRIEQELLRRSQESEMLQNLMLQQQQESAGLEAQLSQRENELTLLALRQRQQAQQAASLYGGMPSSLNAQIAQERELALLSLQQSHSALPSASSLLAARGLGGGSAGGLYGDHLGMGMSSLGRSSNSADSAQSLYERQLLAEAEQQRSNALLRGAGLPSRAGAASGSYTDSALRAAVMEENLLRASRSRPSAAAASSAVPSPPGVLATRTIQDSLSPEDLPDSSRLQVLRLMKLREERQRLEKRQAASRLMEQQDEYEQLLKRRQQGGSNNNDTGDDAKRRKIDIARNAATHDQVMKERYLKMSQQRALESNNSGSGGGGGGGRDTQDVKSMLQSKSATRIASFSPKRRAYSRTKEGGSVATAIELEEAAAGGEKGQDDDNNSEQSGEEKPAGAKNKNEQDTDKAAVGVSCEELIPTNTKAKVTKKKPRVPKPAKAKQIKRTDTKWLNKLEELKVYKKEHGNCIVPRGYMDNPHLASWVAEQRKQFKRLNIGEKSSITKERVKLLEDLGFTWNAQEAAWKLHIGHLKSFVEDTGHTNVPLDCDKYPRLGHWVRVQDRAFTLLKQGRPSTMTPERIKELEAIGYIFHTTTFRQKDNASEQDDSSSSSSGSESSGSDSESEEESDEEITAPAKSRPTRRSSKVAEV